MNLRPLSQVGLPLLVDPSARAAWVEPVLVWESVERQDRERLMLETKAGHPEHHPKAGEPLVLLIEKANNRANAFALGVTVGRTESNDIVVEHDSVSRFHAWLQKNAKGQWTLTDAESRNGTWLGALRLMPRQPQVLRDGAEVRFGDVEMRWLEPPSFLAWVERLARR